MSVLGYLGCDPGLGGGLSLVSDSLSQPMTYKMPETERDLFDLVQSFREFEDMKVSAAIEKVHSSPQMGVKSAFTFGMGYGALRMALIAAAIPFRDVRPQEWQKKLGCLTGGDKNVSKAMAQQLFPTVKWTHATADAALIAEWLRRTEV